MHIKGPIPNLDFGPVNELKAHTSKPKGHVKEFLLLKAFHQILFKNPLPPLKSSPVITLCSALQCSLTIWLASSKWTNSEPSWLSVGSAPPDPSPPWSHPRPPPLSPSKSIHRLLIHFFLFAGPEARIRPSQRK